MKNLLNIILLSIGMAYLGVILIIGYSTPLILLVAGVLQAFNIICFPWYFYLILFIDGIMTYIVGGVFSVKDDEEF